LQSEPFFITFGGTQLFDAETSNNEVIRFGDRYEITLGLYLY